ncbi:MAG: metalloregulator ArsR/SmtB family transcription factor [Novosphingobium sp.]|uniref:ArsR/SmtB family transcription factor n=1 Tax=Novosphingobium sp. TaxID=1874826 RepID=UPI0030171C86
MPLPRAVDLLSALAQGSRLAVFRLLVKAGPDGLPAGTIAREVGVRPNTLSTHLAILEQAGLVTARREGRSVIYAADYGAMRALLGFLVDDCCGGQPDICAPLAGLIPACGAEA